MHCQNKHIYKTGQLNTECMFLKVGFIVCVDCGDTTDTVWNDRVRVIITIININQQAHQGQHANVQYKIITYNSVLKVSRLIVNVVDLQVIPINDCSWKKGVFV